jgi:hypothetical protein
MAEDARAVEFSLTNAFDGSTASVRKVEIQTLSFADEHESKIGFPLGQVGIIASDLDDLSGSIDEMVKHFDHYRESARRYAGPWFSRHNPQKTVEFLVTPSELARRAA